MKTLGLLDAAGLTLALVGGAVALLHIQNSLAQAFAATCLLLGTVWIIFAFRYGLPVRLRTASRMTATNGVVLFSSTLAVLCVLVALVVYRQDPETYEWWFWLCAGASCVATGKMLRLYWALRLRSAC